MKKLLKPLIILSIGIVTGYKLCDINIFKLFNSNYKAFQVGVYTNLDVANTYKSKYKNSIIIKDNELYRLYIAILKNPDNIKNMSNYLNKNGIDYYLKDLNITDKDLRIAIKEYENIMDYNNEIVFLEANKMIMERYEGSL